MSKGRNFLFGGTATQIDEGPSPPPPPAVRLATNIACLPYRDDQVVFSLAGSTLLHNNLGGQGGRDPNDPSLLLPECEGRTQSDDCSKAMGEWPP